MHDAPVAQRIEHRIPNPGVVGSTPAGCATSILSLFFQDEQFIPPFKKTLRLFIALQGMITPEIHYGEAF
jgi:hypothetical protein